MVWRSIVVAVSGIAVGLCAGYFLFSRARDDLLAQTFRNALRADMLSQGYQFVPGSYTVIYRPPSATAATLDEYGFMLLYNNNSNNNSSSSSSSSSVSTKGPVSLRQQYQQQRQSITPVIENYADLVREIGQRKEE